MADLDSRDVALRALAGVDRGGRSDRLLDGLLGRAGLDERDRRLATEMVYGALRRQRQLDRTLEPFSRRPWGKLDPEVRAALRLGAYQAACLGSVPTHAALDRTVAALKRIAPRAAGTVNAVLRAWLRAGGRLYDPGGDEAERLQVPRWLLDRVRERHGAGGLDWLEATLGPPLGAVRVHRAAGALDGVIAELGEEGVRAVPSPWVERALRIEEGQLLSTRLFRAGLLVPRSEAAQLVTELVPTTEGLLLDACAGRGGKALQLADRGGARRVLALDVDSTRLRGALAAVRAAAPATPVAAVAADATAPLPLRAPVAVALADVPCSGLGTIRRHPEIKWRITPRRLARYAALQARILARTAEVIAPGGSLLYVTCSTEPEENEQVVEGVLAARSDLRLQPLAPNGPAAALVGPDGMLRTLGADPDLDGFFAALLRRDSGG